MSERLEERLRRAARTYRRLGNYTAEDIFLRAADAIRELQAENAKLRELVRDLYEMAYPECPSAFEAAFADRMRELGVEVDG